MAEDKSPLTDLSSRLLDASVDGVLAFDRECRYTAWNRAMERISGLRREEVVGRVAFEVFPFLKETGEDKFFQEALAGRSAVSEARPYSVPESGRRGYFDGHYSPVRDEAGRVVGGVGVIRDITERRLAEEALRQSEERYRAFIANSSEGIWRFELERPVSAGLPADEQIELLYAHGYLAECNDAMARMYGYARADEIVGARVGDLLVRDDPANVEYLRSFIASGYRLNEVESVERDREGNPKYFSNSLVGVVEGGRIVRAWGTQRDVTAAKLAENLSRESEERLRRAGAESQRARAELEAVVNTMADGLLVADAAGDMLFMNPAALRLHGYVSPTQVRRHLSDFEVVFEARDQEGRAVAPAEWPLTRVLRGESFRGYELHFRRADTGLTFRGSYGGAPVRDESGAVTLAVVTVTDVSERVALEERRRASEERFAKAFHASPSPIAITTLAEGRYVDVNESFLRMSGYTREEVVGRTVLDLGFWRSPEERERGSEAIRSGRPPLNTEYKFPTKSGETRDLLVSSEIVRIGEEDCALTVMSDITERKRREEGQRFLAEAGRVISSSLDYEATLSAVARMSVPVLADWCAVDLVGEGGALERLAVAHPDPAKVELARALHERYPPDPEDPQGVYNVLRTGRPELYTHVPEELLAAGARDAEHLRVLRELRLASVMVVPLAARGRTLGAITFVSAESGRRFGPDDLALAESLSQQASYAIDNARLYAQSLGANRLKDEFLATLSHELRTPLTAVLGWAQMLGAGGLDAETARRAVEAIRRNAESQRQIVEDVLDASRIVAGKLRIEPEEVELLGVVRESLDAVRPAAEAKHIELICNFDPQVGPIVGDPHRLRQVVWNLLSNAVKFTGAGGQVKIEAGHLLSSVRLTVSDTGQGIAPDFLPYVFERFRQADGSTTRQHGGLGLGLSIVRHLVEAHGGSVHAYSAGLGQGASFTVDLPLPAAPRPVARTETVESQPTPSDVARTAPSRETPPALLGVRVLLVEDDPDTLELTKVFLRRHGAEVTAVASAEDALSALADDRPDVIVSDIGMPGMDGYELLRRVRALSPDEGGLTPALALTAYAGDADRVHALRAGFQSHVSKPVNPPALLEAVAALAARARSDIS
ncbi:MAG TPA: PAS domain S-box protein [Pyrinomonadaceae bacterium]|nr:PAS domain S-box protein [Pyrinomonadaceae bacterium]